MKRRRITAASLILVLALLSLSFKCGDGSNGGPAQQTDQVKQAAKAADDIATTVNAMIKAKRDLLSSKLISKDESNQLSKLLKKVNDADRTFYNRVKQLAQFDATNKPNFATLFTSVTSAIDELNTSGVLGIKNADAKSKLSILIATINAAVTTIKALLQ
jgi:hypothetical protein